MTSFTSMLSTSVLQ